MFGKRKKIVKKLNECINNYEELVKLSNLLDNDYDKVVENINNIIKYAFVCDDFLYSEIPLTGIVSNLRDVEKKYQEYRMKHKNFSFAKVRPTSFPLASDLDFKDIYNLDMPSEKDIKDIIKKNKEEKEQSEKLLAELENSINKEKKFINTALTYYRTDLVKITDVMTYEYEGMSGDIKKDYKKLYSDKKYADVADVLNPLNKDYITNLKSIKNNNDISLVAIGNVYRIVNGRKRILYIINNSDEELIPAKVTYRIENKKLNEVLIKLKEKYDVELLKNNVLIDNESIIIVYDKKAYFLSNFEEIQKFCSDVLDNKKISKYTNIEFERTEYPGRRSIFKEYCILLYNEYLNYGEKTIYADFMDVVKIFDGLDNSILYDAYIYLQQEYSHAKTFNYKLELAFGSGNFYKQDSEPSLKRK